MTKCTRAGVPLAVLALVGLPWEPAFAGDAASDSWIVTIGASIAAEPDYAGAKSYGPTYAPSFSIRRAGTPDTFGAPDDSFGFTLLEFSGIEIGPLAAVRTGRSDGAVLGLPGYSWSFETGMFAEFWPIAGHLRTRAEVLYGLNANDGLTVNLAADAVAKTGRYTWAAGPRLTLADSTVMQTEFGISPGIAILRPWLTPYNAQGGLKSAGAAVSVAYEWSENWTVTAFANYDRLLGDAASSPVTSQYGSANQVTIGMGVDYSFTWSPGTLPLFTR